MEQVVLELMLKQVPVVTSEILKHLQYQLTLIILQVVVPKGAKYTTGVITWQQIQPSKSSMNSMTYN
jgi:hypothetical protein